MTRADGDDDDALDDNVNEVDNCVETKMLLKKEIKDKLSPIPISVRYRLADDDPPVVASAAATAATSSATSESTSI